MPTSPRWAQLLRRHRSLKKLSEIEPDESELDEIEDREEDRNNLDDVTVTDGKQNHF